MEEGTNTFTSKQNKLSSLGGTALPSWEEIRAASQQFSGRLGTKAQEFLLSVEKHFQSQHSPLFYAENLNITCSYLRKICQQFIGSSPSDCIYAKIIREAKTLLDNHDLTIQQVAEILGFADPAYFNRFFKKHCGLPPHTFRKNAGEKNEFPNRLIFVPNNPITVPNNPMHNDKERYIFACIN
ncbi:MAG: helix-turn-helix domain-containing protein [Bacteroidetes bacterium]|nr:helix-turn-helix domain-containing protein [Bacteroidota bacterium]